MRVLFFFLPAVLMAQTPAAPPKAPATPPKTAGTTAPKAAPKAAAPATTAPAKVAPTLATDDDKIIYALGLSMYRQLGQFGLSPAELEIVKRALTDAAANKPAIDLNTWGPRIGALAGTRAAKIAEREKAASVTYLAKCAAEPGAEKSPTGLVYKSLRAGTGPSPKATDRVRVNYRGTLMNGTEFDSSYKHNPPAEFGLNQVIKCWTEGVQKMKVGGKAQLVCPSDLAYGDGGGPGIPGGSTLTFEVELLDIVH